MEMEATMEPETVGSIGRPNRQPAVFALGGVLAVASLFFSSSNAKERIMSADEAAKVLSSFVGTWEVDVTIHDQNDKGKTAKQKAIEVNSMFGSKWLISHFKNEEIAYEVRVQIGFDPAKKKYIYTAISNAEPGIVIMEGEYDARNKTLTLTSISDQTDPQSGKQMKSRITIVLKDTSREFREDVRIEGSKEYFRFMEAVYRPSLK
jgi:hypothetical protein